MRKVILVDTSTAVYEQLAAPLGEAGVSLVLARGPMDAMVLARGEKPDAVVINLTLPGRVGDFTFSLLRYDETTARVPVVFLIDRLRWGRRAGDAAADALVPTPWEPGRVLSALGRATSRGQGLPWTGMHREGCPGHAATQ